MLHGLAMRWMWLLSLSLSGCYLAHERGDAPTPPTGSVEWSEITTVFEPEAVRPVLQGSEHATVALEDGFLVLWLYNQGQIGIAAARFDEDARVRSGPTVTLEAMPPLSMTPDALDALALPGGARAYWVSIRDGRVRSVRVDADGRPLGDPEVLVEDAGPRHLFVRVVQQPSARYLAYVRGDALALVPLDDEGVPAGEPFSLYERPDGEPIWQIGGDADLARVSWTVRMPGGADEIFHATARWDGSARTPPVSLVSADNIVGGPIFAAEGALWLETTTFERAEVLRLDDPGVRLVVSESPNRGSSIFTLPGGGHAALTSESDRRFELSTRLVFRRLDFRARSAHDPFQAAPDRCTIEGYRVAHGADALAVTWVDHCGVRRLHARVRRSR